MQHHFHLDAVCFMLASL